MTDRQRNAFILALVAGLVLASLVVIAGIPGAVKSHKTELGLDLKGGVQLIYEGEPTPQTPHVTQAALQRAVDIMNQRVNQLGVSEPQISTSGSNDITVQLPAVQNTKRAEQLVGTTARLEFYDWEANALTPTGQTVASQLATQDPSAISISQGSGTAAAPGSPGAGSMSLYQAVQLAAKQPLQVSKGFKPKRRLAVDRGYELVHPRFKRTVVDKDVKPALLRNLDAGWKRLQPTDAWTPLASDEDPIIALQGDLPKPRSTD